MRALRKTSAGPGLELVDVPEPEPGPGEVKVRVLRTGICGTDLHIDSWDAWAAATIAAPLIPGHEFSGIVDTLGAGVTSVAVGDLVSGEGHIVCGKCRNCRAGRRHLCVRTSSLGVNRDGAFADYVVMPEGNLWVQGADVAPELAAIFDPLGNAVHTALQFSVVGEDVLITGAGPIGLMAAKVARHVGARYVVVSDVNEQRLEIARSMGVDLAVDVRTERIEDAQRRLGMREGFDVGLEISGQASALTEMLSNMNHGGRVAVLGLPTEPIAVDWVRVVTHMLTIQGVYGRQMYETWYEMSAMLASGLDVSGVISDTFPAAEWESAFARARSGNAGKVIIDWSDA